MTFFVNKYPTSEFSDSVTSELCSLADSVAGQRFEWRTPDGKLLDIRHDKQTQIQKASVVVNQNEQLGLLIRGGEECGLGIFVSGVSQHSVAWKLGLQPGDQLLEVNGYSFHRIHHNDAVKILSESSNQGESSSTLDVSFKRMGRLPHSPVTCLNRHLLVDDHSPDREVTRDDFSDQQEINMVMEKAHALLDQSHVSLLMFYLAKYRNREMSVESLLVSLQNIFDTQDKEGLFTEIDELIFKEDIEVYNKIVFENGKLFERFLININENQLFSTESRSCFDINYSLDTCSTSSESLNSFGDGSDVSHRHEKENQTKSFSRFVQNPQRLNSNFNFNTRKFERPGDTGVQHENPNTVRRKSMPKPDTKSQWSHSLPARVRHSHLIQTVPRLSSGNNEAIRLEIKKNNRLLGMVIEGGKDTLQKEPRIINIQPGGQAWETAGLRVGQIIKQVDGINLKGLQHRDIAKLLWNRYSRSEGDTLSLTVIQQTPSPQQLRRSVMLPQ